MLEQLPLWQQVILAVVIFGAYFLGRFHGRKRMVTPIPYQPYRNMSGGTTYNK